MDSLRLLTPFALQEACDYLNKDLAAHGVRTARGTEYRIDAGKLQAALNDECRECEGRRYVVMNDDEIQACDCTPGLTDKQAAELAAEDGYVTRVVYRITEGPEDL